MSGLLPRLAVQLDEGGKPVEAAAEDAQGHGVPVSGCADGGCGSAADGDPGGDGAPLVGARRDVGVFQGGPVVAFPGERVVCLDGVEQVQFFVEQAVVLAHRVAE